MLKQKVTPLNTTYIEDMNQESKLNAFGGFINTHSYVTQITLPTSAFSPIGSEYLSVVNATKGKSGDYPVIRLRVLTRNHGITVTIFCSDELLYRRYRSLLFQMRNRQMQVTFPSITCHQGKKSYGMFFTATDFKFKALNEPPEPVVYI